MVLKGSPFPRNLQKTPIFVRKLGKPFFFRWANLQTSDFFILSKEVQRSQTTLSFSAEEEVGKKRETLVSWKPENAWDWRIFL